MILVSLFKNEWENNQKKISTTQNKTATLGQVMWGLEFWWFKKVFFDQSFFFYPVNIAFPVKILSKSSINDKRIIEFLFILNRDVIN